MLLYTLLLFPLMCLLFEEVIARRSILKMIVDLENDVKAIRKNMTGMGNEINKSIGKEKEDIKEVRRRLQTQKGWLMLTGGEMNLTKGQVISRLDKVEKEYNISFDVKADSFDKQGYTSVVHLTTHGDTDAYGSRTPAIWFHNSGKEASLVFYSAVNGIFGSGYRHETSKTYAHSIWISVEVAQVKVEAGYQYTIRVNNVLEHSVMNTFPQGFPDVKVYASNPWSEAQRGYIRNFKFYTPSVPLRCTGEDGGCCTHGRPCGLGEGDCDDDADCSGSLQCGTDRTTWTENCPWGDKDDCCVAPQCLQKTISGPNTGSCCILPFRYKGKTYSSCTNVDHDQLWCSTTFNYEGKWGHCQVPSCERRVKGSPGECCAFPFQYEGKLYTNCTDVRRGEKQYWCSTTPRYEEKWGYCQDERKPPYLISTEDCFQGCKQRGGICAYCGKNAYCCRKGWNDCPKIYADVASDHHTCVQG